MVSAGVGVGVPLPVPVTLPLKVRVSVPVFEGLGVGLSEEVAVVVVVAVAEVVTVAVLVRRGVGEAVSAKGTELTTTSNKSHGTQMPECRPTKKTTQQGPGICTTSCVVVLLLQQIPLLQCLQSQSWHNVPYQ